jgi:hypothetical protein
MANTVDQFPTEANEIQDDDWLKLRRGTGVNSDKKMRGSAYKAQFKAIPANGLIYGSVTWASGLIFDVSECQYVIDGVTYTSPPIQLTLGAADADDPRIDVIKVSASSVASVEAGTPAPDPAKPEIDPLTELELTFITISALATEPDGVSAQALYLEDAGDPGEWDATENTAAARIDLASVADPWAGTKSILLDAATIDDVVTLTGIAC